MNWISVFLLFHAAFFQFLTLYKWQTFSLKKHNWHLTKHVFLSFSWFKKLPEETLGSVHAFIATHQKKKDYLKNKFPYLLFELIPFIFQQGRKRTISWMGTKRIKVWKPRSSIPMSRGRSGVDKIRCGRPSQYSY